MSLPDGYDTKVGSFGSRFSGGEKQRIAIARAILKNAPILILDEATSASDPENQMEIDRAIQNLCKGKTVIVVAHRLSALKMCERVLTMIAVSRIQKAELQMRTYFMPLILWGRYIRCISVMHREI